MAVLKFRGGIHSKSLCFYQIKNFVFLSLGLLYLGTGFSQDKITWENQIYAVTDVLVAEPDAQGIAKTEWLEKKFYQSAQVKSSNDYLALVIMLCNRGYYQYQLGRTTNAITTYENAWRVFVSKRLDRYDIVEYCCKPLANLYLQTGQYNLAENCIKQYYDWSVMHKNTAQKISAIINLSIVYQNTGQQSRAINILKEALQTEMMPVAQRCKIWNNLATNYMLVKEFVQAQTYLNLILKANVDEVLQWNALRNLVQICLENKAYKQAMDYVVKAENLSQRLKSVPKRDLARFQFEKATVWYHWQHPAAAENAIAKIYELLLPQIKNKKNLPAIDDLYLDVLFLDVLDLQKNILQLQRKNEEALRCAEQAFLFEEKLIRSLTFEQNQLIHQTQSHKRVEWCLGVCFDLYKKTKDQNWIIKAFLLVENHKSALMLGNQQKFKNLSVKEKELFAELNSLGLLIEKEQQKYSNANIAKLNQWIAKQTQCVLALKTIQQKDEVGKTWNWEDIKRFLKVNNQALISYFLGEEHVYQFKFEKGQLNFYDLGSSNGLKNKIRSYLNYFSGPDMIANHVKGFTHTSHQLFLSLHLQGIEDKKIVIIPDGLLCFLPFETLVSQPSASVNFSKIPFLTVDKEISYAYSTTTLKTDYSKTAKPKVLGVFPVFKDSNEELIFSEMEKKYLENHFEGKFEVGNKASFKTFVQEAKNYAILHLSTHASSGDLETSASIKFIDREVYYSELYGLNLHPDLVVLSACETGIGKLYSGDSPLNVARGFQVAGASNLVFTLWKVNDFTTSKFMQYLYQQLQQQQSYVQSLHSAKLAFLQDSSIPNAKKSPYYWGAFVYYGQLESERGMSFLFAIGLFTLLVVFVVEVLFFIKMKTL